MGAPRFWKVKKFCPRPNKKRILPERMLSKLRAEFLKNKVKLKGKMALQTEGQHTQRKVGKSLSIQFRKRISLQNQQTWVQISIFGFVSWSLTMTMAFSTVKW